ncbi:hypothetical protein RFI_21432, partial [Reticulomyxa filosa]
EEEEEEDSSMIPCGMDFINHDISVHSHSPMTENDEAKDDPLRVPILSISLKLNHPIMPNGELHITYGRRHTSSDTFVTYGFLDPLRFAPYYSYPLPKQTQAEVDMQECSARSTVVQRLNENIGVLLGLMPQDTNGKFKQALLEYLFHYTLVCEHNHMDCTIPMTLFLDSNSLHFRVRPSLYKYLRLITLSPQEFDSFHIHSIFHHSRDDREQLHNDQINAYVRSICSWQLQRFSQSLSQDRQDLQDMVRYRQRCLQRLARLSPRTHPKEVTTLRGLLQYMYRHILTLEYIIREKGAWTDCLNLQFCYVHLYIYNIYIRAHMYVYTYYIYIYIFFFFGADGVCLVDDPFAIALRKHNRVCISNNEKPGNSVSDKGDSSNTITMGQPLVVSPALRLDVSPFTELYLDSGISTHHDNQNATTAIGSFPFLDNISSMPYVSDPKNLFVEHVKNDGQVLTVVRERNSDSVDHTSNQNTDEVCVSQIHGAQLIRSPANDPSYKGQGAISQYGSFSNAQRDQDETVVAMDLNDQNQNAQTGLYQFIKSLIPEIVSNTNHLSIHDDNAKTK